MPRLGEATEDCRPRDRIEIQTLSPALGEHGQLGRLEPGKQHAGGPVGIGARKDLLDLLLALTQAQDRLFQPDPLRSPKIEIQVLLRHQAGR